MGDDEDDFDADTPWEAYQEGYEEGVRDALEEIKGLMEHYGEGTYDHILKKAYTFIENLVTEE